MASITICNLDEQTKARLRVRVARRKRSIEEEVRDILRTALAEEAAGSLNLARSAISGADIRKREKPLARDRKADRLTVSVSDPYASLPYACETPKLLAPT